MKKLILLFLLLPMLVCDAAIFRSIRSGLFSDSNTWTDVSATFPNATGDSWTVSNAHTVYYDANNSNSGGWGLITNNGFLVITQQVWLKMNSLMYAPTGTSGFPRRTAA